MLPSASVPPRLQFAMKVIPQILLVGVLAAGAAAAWHYREQLSFVEGDGAEAARGPGAPSSAVLVEAVAAETGEVSTTIKAVGTARAYDAVNLTASVSGIVTRIAFNEGQWVEKGVVLIELDAGAMPAELAELRAELDVAKRLHERARTLRDTGGVSVSRLDELEAEVATSTARVRGRELMLANYLIRAPFSGRLGLRRISVGTLIQPGDEITTLDDTARIKVDFRVPETALAALKTGQTVEARSVAFPDQRFEGRVETLDSRVDPATRSIEVRTLLPNDGGLLRPGMFLTATLVVSRRLDAVLIPEEAIISRSDGQHVFAVIDGLAVLTPVILGIHLGGKVEVVSGLAPGIEVIIGGVQKVRDGTSVEVIPPAAGNGGGDGA